MLTVFRLAGGFKRNFGSAESAYLATADTPRPEVAAARATEVDAAPQPAPVSAMDSDCGAEPFSLSDVSAKDSSQSLSSSAPLVGEVPLASLVKLAISADPTIDSVPSAVATVEGSRL